MSSGTLYRIAAFSATPDGGNPAGVWVGDELPAAQEMQAIAADVGFSETAFVAPAEGAERTVRYYSPEIEVPFCGHATVAAGYVLGTDDKTTYSFATTVGEVPVTVRSQDGEVLVSLKSVEPQQKPVPEGLLEETVQALGWHLDELDPAIPPMMIFAGIWHLALAVKTETRLADLDYDFDGLRVLMQDHNFLTAQLIWRESHALFRARDPFPIGGIVEDPATGSAAAALGGYLRDANLLDAPAQIEIRQGEAMGRPSRLCVDIPESGGILVSGTAVPMS